MRKIFRWFLRIIALLVLLGISVLFWMPIIQSKLMAPPPEPVGSAVSPDDGGGDDSPVDTSAEDEAASNISLRLFAEPPEAQIAEYNADKRKSIVQLQQFRETSSIEFEDKNGRAGTATLINLNPRINTWFLLQIEWQDGRDRMIYHLENQDPEEQQVILDAEYPLGLIFHKNEEEQSCDLWSGLV